MVYSNLTKCAINWTFNINMLASGPRDSATLKLFLNGIIHAYCLKLLLQNLVFNKFMLLVHAIVSHGTVNCTILCI